ncbi:MAG: DUF4255 domain-containing protein [Candidatus Korobacteraceae bacterium]|jgi:hypothetical protein
MSNYLAIATVTGALYQVLHDPVKSAVTGAVVRFRRPDRTDDQEGKPHVNVYLYQVTPNAAFRNIDLPTRRADGTLVKQPVAALDLHYLFTFHGKDDQLEPQLMLGAVAVTLETQPLLSPQNIQSATANFSFLNKSDLTNQVERIRFTPTALTLEEFSKLWSAFFQVEYSLSAAYQASVVLMSDETPPQEALPVQHRKLHVAPFTQPTITQVMPKGGAAGQPILPTSTLVIQGTQLLGDITTVRIGDTTVTPPVVTENAIIMPVPAGVQAGVLGLQVVQQLQLGHPAEPHPGWESNVVALVLQPVLSGPSITGTTLSVAVNPDVQPGQRVTLILNQIPTTSPPTPTAYSFDLPPFTVATGTLACDVTGVASGVYFIRAKVDGAESPLDLASPGGGPTVTVT